MRNQRCAASLSTPYSDVGLTSSAWVARRGNPLVWQQGRADAPADPGYLSSQMSSMRQPLVMLLTMIVNPFL
jgi:hypothetical protein